MVLFKKKKRITQSAQLLAQKAESRATQGCSWALQAANGVCLVGFQNCLGPMMPFFSSFLKIFKEIFPLLKCECS